MQKLYLYTSILLGFFVFLSTTSRGQDCSLLNANILTYESRCASTGSIKVIASGGSGSYKYKVTGPVNTNFTSTDSITGLSAGTYSVIVTDLVTNCSFTQSNVVVDGSYNDPRFTLTGNDVTCDNGSNGSIVANNLENGRAPFLFTIDNPSPMGVGTSDSAGIFNGLIAGTYSIRLTDSCGGIQTRQVTINNYTWSIDSYVFNKISCDSAIGHIQVSDSRGNISTVDSLPGFSYGIVLQPGDTLWSSSPFFTFNLAGNSSFIVVAKDGCGNIKSFNTSVSLAASVGTSVSIFNKTCNSFSVSIDSVNNFFNGNFCLYDSSNNQVECNSSGTFSNLSYGTYCIHAHDSCTDTTITRCFTATPPILSVADNVQLSNEVCQTFSASITGQVNLTNPQYCIYDTSGNLINCNTTGVFDSLSYGSYCIKTKDGCIDSTITRCFNATRPMPAIDSIIPSYGNCSVFGLNVGGSGLVNANYCLYDSIGNLIECDSSGIFDSIPLGSYCIHIYDPCLDTTFIKCFSIGPPVVINDLGINLTNKTCSTFTASATTHNIQNAFYCLYDTANVLIACDSSGRFDSLPYGHYCIQSKLNCPDTTFLYCFNASPPIPNVNASVAISNNTCTTFTAKITGQQNLTSPQFCLYDSNDVQVSCNTTGIFDSLTYGNYCIKIVNSCYDTTITRCFTATLHSINISVNVGKSCTYGLSKFGVSVSGGALPVNLVIYDTANNIYLDTSYNTTSFSIDKIPGLDSSGHYTVVASDNCGNSDTAYIVPVTSYLNHAVIVNNKCPGSNWPNGAGDIIATANTNMGSLTVKIIQKDSTRLAPQLSPDIVSGSLYTFQNYGPGTYVLQYKANDGCGVYLYDTITISPYQFPSLDRSSAYNCDAGGFSIGAVTSNGVGPFSYEIIGSTPSTPSLTAPPQGSPIFNVNNGTTYSLIRLRALDACGNATLGDASVLPLAINEITNTSNCFSQPTTLSIDSINNSSYQWFKKQNAGDTDSTLIGTGSSYFVPSIQPSDTGIYICHLEVFGGCISRTYQYHLDASCYTVLPVIILDFSGKYAGGNILISWQTSQENNIDKYIVERMDNNNSFTAIGEKKAVGSGNAPIYYSFLDLNPDPILNYYRLSVFGKDGSVTYSKILLLSADHDGASVSVYPNPVDDVINIKIKNSQNHSFKISLYNSINQLIKETSLIGGTNSELQIPRTKSMSRGMYIIRIIDEAGNEQFTKKIILK